MHSRKSRRRGASISFEANAKIHLFFYRSEVPLRQMGQRFRPQVRSSATERLLKFCVTPPVPKNSLWCAANAESLI